MESNPDKKPTILIIDDDPAYTSVVRVILERDGYPVLALEAAPSQLLEYIEQHRIALIVLDRVMPEPDGMAVLKQLRATLSSTELPVILTSASESIPDIEQAFELGVNSYIFKLLPPKELLAQIQECLNTPGHG